MLVTCKGCKKKIDRDKAFKVVVKDKNTYYCDALEYEDINREKENRLKSIDLAFEIIGKTTNTSLMKELTEIAKVHTYTKLLNFMEQNIVDINIAMDRNDFVHEYAKIRYFAAIIKNQIGDFKEIETENTEVHDFDYVEEVKYTPTKKKSFANYLDEY